MTTVLNNWDGYYFKFNNQTLAYIMIAEKTKHQCQTNHIFCPLESDEKGDVDLTDLIEQYFDVKKLYDENRKIKIVLRGFAEKKPSFRRDLLSVPHVNIFTTQEEDERRNPR